MNQKTAKTTENDEETKEKEAKKNEVQPSKEILITEKAGRMTETYGEHFDKSAFKAAAKAYLEKHDTLDGFDAEAFVKKPEDDKEKEAPNEAEANGKCYKGGYEDGKFVFRGPRGDRIEGKDFAEANDKICAIFAKEAKEEGREATICTRWHNVPEAREKKEREDFSRNAIKHGMTILDGWSKDSQVWHDLKKDYLADKNHKLEDWERMTRKIPDEVMQRTPEEKARNKKLNDADIIAQMRKGNNPNLQTAAPAEQTPNTSAVNVKEASSQAAAPAEKGGKTGDAALIDQMRHGVNPNVPETMPQSQNKTQTRPGQEKQLTPEEIQAAVLRQAKRQHV